VEKRFRPPITLLIIAAVLLVVGLVMNSLMSTLSEDVLRDNLMIMAIPFLAIFIAILLFYIGLINTLMRAFSGHIPPRVYRVLFGAAVVGIVLGVIMMFQPWALAIYRVGFMILLVSLLSFMVISHISPRQKTIEEL
jgi:hypothetical protein